MLARAARRAAARAAAPALRGLSSAEGAAGAPHGGGTALPPREVIQVDVAVVGGGPAGLAAALRLKQVGQRTGWVVAGREGGWPRVERKEKRRSAHHPPRLVQRATEAGADISVAVLDKAATPGAHTLSGAVIDPRPLATLLGESWAADAGSAAGVPLTRDAFYFLARSGHSLRLPVPPAMRGKKVGARIVSLSELVAWLASRAEAAGVDLLPGFAATDVILDGGGAVAGVVTGDSGVSKDGRPGPRFARGAEIRARATLLAEGCRGSLSERVMERYGLRRDCQPQTYALGLKEVWSVPPDRHSPGTAWHTVGAPLDGDTYGGGFLYHMGGDGHRVAVG